jgi:hypothetical protein
VSSTNNRMERQRCGLAGENIVLYVTWAADVTERPPHVEKDAWLDCCFRVGGLVGSG